MVGQATGGGTGRIILDATANGSGGLRLERLRRLLRHRPSVVALVIMLALILSAALAPVISPYDQYEMNFSVRLEGPGIRHLLGTDESGRDLLTRMFWGGRITLMVALGAVVMASMIGIPWGMVAAYRGGITDDILMRIVDGFMAFPGLVLALLVIASLGPDIKNLVLTMGILGAPPFARIARAAVLAERGHDYVLAAVATGASGPRILTKYIAPNCVAPLMVQISLGSASVILTEAALSFLGLGVQPPDASWATLLKQGYSFLSYNAWYVTFPGIAIFMTVWSLNTLGDGLRDALDPRLRSSGAA